MREDRRRLAPRMARRRKLAGLHSACTTMVIARG